MTKNSNVKVARKPASFKALVTAAVILSIVNSLWAMLLYRDVVLTGALIVACCFSARMGMRKDTPWLRVFVTSAVTVATSLALAYALPSPVFHAMLVQPKVLSLLTYFGAYLPIVFGMVTLLAGAFDSWWTKSRSATPDLQS